ncbi:MAG: hypothetical protein ACHQ4H_07945 [Ktedonobacterales bacterium]
MRSIRPEEQRSHAKDISRDHKSFVSRSRQHLMVLFAPLFLLLASAGPRHWLAQAVATFCVAGGFVAAPFLTVTAWIGLALPPQVLLHRASTALFLMAIIWMAAALIGAHLHHHRHSDTLLYHTEDGN